MDTGKLAQRKALSVLSAALLSGTALCTLSHPALAVTFSACPAAPAPGAFGAGNPNCVGYAYQAPPFSCPSTVPGLCYTLPAGEVTQFQYSNSGPSGSVQLTMGLPAGTSVNTLPVLTTSNNGATSAACTASVTNIGPPGNTLQIGITLPNTGGVTVDCAVTLGSYDDDGLGAVLTATPPHLGLKNPAASVEAVAANCNVTNITEALHGANGVTIAPIQTSTTQTTLLAFSCDQLSNLTYNPSNQSGVSNTIMVDITSPSNGTKFLQSPFSDSSPSPFALLGFVEADTDQFVNAKDSGPYTFTSTASGATMTLLGTGSTSGTSWTNMDVWAISTEGASTTFASGTYCPSGEPSPSPEHILGSVSGNTLTFTGLGASGDTFKFLSYPGDETFAICAYHKSGSGVMALNNKGPAPFVSEKKVIDTTSDVSSNLQNLEPNGILLNGKAWLFKYTGTLGGGYTDYLRVVNNDAGGVLLFANAQDDAGGQFWGQLIPLTNPAGPGNSFKGNTNDLIPISQVLNNVGWVAGNPNNRVSITVYSSPYSDTDNAGELTTPGVDVQLLAGNPSGSAVFMKSEH